MKYPVISLLLFICLVSACGQEQKTPAKSAEKVKICDNFRKFYEEFEIKGSFALYDPQKKTYFIYNQSQFRTPFTPASTFKICNSLIGLETGVIPDEHFTLPWDGTVYPIPNWNADHDMAQAFEHSTVWYYQELARRVGGKRMKYWLDKAHYGNRDTTGGIDKFWLSGNLRITPEQQIRFLRKLHDGELPFSQRSMDIVKKIMISADTNGYVIHSKTGWGIQDGINIGWYVGYVETHGKVYYFANCVQSRDETPWFIEARRAICLSELKALNIIPR